jgi:serine/threonine protein kinase
MSPEQASGKKVDARSDIFAFGALLYEMLTGERAFQGDSNMVTLAAILNQEPKPLHQVRPDVPADLQKLIARCLRRAQSLLVAAGEHEDLRLIFTLLNFPWCPVAGSGLVKQEDLHRIFALSF